MPRLGLRPDAAVIVATVRALKMHGGVGRIVAGKPLDPALLEDDAAAVQRGGSNLVRQLEIVPPYGVPAVVAINLFPTDAPAEIAALREIAIPAGARDAVVARHFTDGGAGAEDLARRVGRGRGGRPRVPAALPGRRDAAREDRDDRDPDLRRGRRRHLPAAARRSRSSRRWGSGACRCAWPRPSTPSATIPS